MKPIRPILIAATLALSLPARVVAAEPSATAPAWHRPGAAMHALLRHLDLTADQKGRIEAIHSAAKPRAEALREASRANRDALATTPPTDPAYAGLIDQSKANAATAIQMRSDVWTQVYAVLTPEQRAKVPALMAAARAKHKARAEEWAHGEFGPP
jgi:Spy/CpxP family protein refolding chaperone